jgi:hypothetical protein
MGHERGMRAPRTTRARSLAVARRQAPLAMRHSAGVATDLRQMTSALLVWPTLADAGPLLSA